ANLSGDPEQEYFADGTTEALITELGKISTQRVISRQSIMQYKGQEAVVRDCPGTQRRCDSISIADGGVFKVKEQLVKSITDAKCVAEAAGVFFHTSAFCFL